MSRFIVVPEPTAYGITYTVRDVAKDEKVTQYGCELWANHKAQELNNEAKHGNSDEGEQDMR